MRKLICRRQVIPILIVGGCLKPSTCLISELSTCSRLICVINRIPRFRRSSSNVFLDFNSQHQWKNRCALLSSHTKIILSIMLSNSVTSVGVWTLVPSFVSNVYIPRYPTPGSSTWLGSLEILSESKKNAVVSRFKYILVIILISQMIRYNVCKLAEYLFSAPSQASLFRIL